MNDILHNWGYDGDPKNIARVTGSWGGYYRIVCNEGEGVARRKASSFRSKDASQNPATGDFVRIQWNAQGESRIMEVLPRFTSFVRSDPSSSGRKCQVIAVNFHVLIFIMSLNENFNLNRMDRFLAIASSTGAQTLVLLNKADLITKKERDDYLHQAQERIKNNNNTHVFAVSVATGEGLENVKPFIRPRKTVAVIGSSGVGKSSFINYLAGEEIMPTFEIREKDGKGRHTTTERELMLLGDGTIVMDTPGMREVGLWEADQGISRNFSDIEAIASKCRFSNCRHDTEPECAIKAALKSGELPLERWETYLRLANSPAEEPKTRRISNHRFRMK
jgi:ribosome biogenesis GTPase